MIFKQQPINKNIIRNLNNKLFIPYLINENKWKEIYTHSWFKCLIYKYNIKNKNNSGICGIDIGCKNFVTIYSPSGICFRIIVNKLKINNILKNKNITYEQKDKRINNLINELHIQTSRLICNYFQEIYIGQIYSKDEINSKKFKTTRDNLKPILSHNKFLNILQNFSNKYKKKLYIVDESFTSKHCGNCGELKNKFKRIKDGNDSDRRKFICDFCNYKLHRDINAARLIIIKNKKNL